MTALTDHGFGFGRDDVFAMDLAAVRADMKTASAQEVKRQTVSNTVAHLVGGTQARFIFLRVTDVLDTLVSSKLALRRFLCSQAKYFVISKQWKGRVDFCLLLQADHLNLQRHFRNVATLIGVCMIETSRIRSPSKTPQLSV